MTDLYIRKLRNGRIGVRLSGDNTEVEMTGDEPRHLLEQAGELAEADDAFLRSVGISPDDRAGLSNPSAARKSATATGFDGDCSWTVAKK